MILKFPENFGGEEHGLNDPGVETFMGDIGGYLAREAAQNSIDAAKQTPILLEFDVHDVPLVNLPCLADLRQVLHACKEFWKGNPKTIDFCERALNVLQQDKVKLLEYSDLQTSGLAGSDDDRQNSWYGLVRSGGASFKGEGQGGSFGIGKYAPFAASHLRTVYYSSLNHLGEYIFQGVSRLMTHVESSGNKTQGVGYIGDYHAEEKKFLSVRNPQRIPTLMKRKEHGTSVFVPGFRLGDDWETVLIRSVLANFWPAIHFERVMFRTCEHEITKDNLANYLNMYADDDDFDAHTYYQALTSAEKYQFAETIPPIGNVELYVALGHNLSKRVALTRATGMVVDFWEFRPRKAFCGLFVCQDEKGNKILSRLEPPRHDRWDPNRLSEEEYDGNALVKSLKAWIREQVKSIMPVDDSDEIFDEEVARYLPDDLDEEESFDSDQTGDEENRETFESVPTDAESMLIPLDPIRTGEAVGNEQGQQEGGDTGGDYSPAGGDGVATGGNLRETGDHGSKGSDDVVGIQSRIYPRDGQLVLILKADDGFDGEIRLFAVGEDGTEMAFDIKAAFDDNTGEVIACYRNTLSGFTIPASQAVKIRVSPVERETTSLKVVGHAS